MKVLQKKYVTSTGWENVRNGDFDQKLSQLVLVFGNTEVLASEDIFAVIRQHFPVATILFSSTAGEIIDTEVNDNSLSLTAVYFEKSTIQNASAHIDDVKDSYTAGEELARLFDPQGLKSVLVICDGQKVNGSELVSGLQKNLPAGTLITGGLAGDGSRFKKTLVGLNEPPFEGRIAAIGFYGDQLSVSSGNMGGWDPFGPERLITRSSGNVLYELDNKPALDIYKMYLGNYASELPSSGLLFPLSFRNDSGDVLVRTILSVNEEEKSLTFAGNMPEGHYARLMKANFDRIIEGSSIAAQQSMGSHTSSPDLSILISCVGRKLVLNHRVEEEVEVIRKVYGQHTTITGFYSYGEISPSFQFSACELHNQTMTITTLTEK